MRQRIGIGGFAVGLGFMPGLGGVTPSIPSTFVARCKVAGIPGPHFLTFNSGSYYETNTPFGEWFDDAGWTNKVIPALTQVAVVAKAAGFDGIGFDNEGYPGGDSRSPTWKWDYPGRTHTEAEVRAKARSRGQAVGNTLAAAFPGIKLISYHDYFDASFMATVQHVVNGAPLNASSTQTVAAEFWDGVTSAPNRGSITFCDATFYFCPVLPGWTNDAAMAKNRDDMNAMFVARGWQSTYVTPFLWMGPTNGDGTAWTQDHSMQPAEALAAAQAAHRYAQNGMVANYDYEGDPLRYLADPFVPFTSANRHIVSGDFRPAYLAAAGK